jgi:hypothetical protein
MQQCKILNKKSKVNFLAMLRSSEHFFRSQYRSLIVKFPSFMKPENSLSSSQEPLDHALNRYTTLLPIPFKSI